MATMRAVLDVVLLLTGALLVVPALVLVIECLAGVLPLARRKVPAADAPRVAILIPAHDEEAGIGGTVSSLIPELGPRDRILVVADNCTDGTAAAARRAADGQPADVAARVQVVERHDADRRGKGHAIAFGMAALDADPPQVVVLVDADCRIQVGGTRQLAALAASADRPVQADYVLEAAPRPTPLAQIGALAILVRNRVRPRGLARLGLPCQLTGSGMAFPWAVLRSAPSLGSQIVEDLVLGLELALAGRPSLACPEVVVTSVLPEADVDAAKQRRRWEHGQMATLLAYAPRLLARGLGRLDAGLLALGLDLAVPPLALLCLMVGAQLGAGWLWAWAGGSRVPLVLGAAALAMVATAVLIAWARFGRQAISATRLALIPLYVAWKIPLYLAFVIRRETAWRRTRRSGEPPPP